MLCLADIQLPLDGWTVLESADHSNSWRNQVGDQMDLDFFGIAPDLPAPLDDLQPLRALYREMLGESGGLVEVEEAIIGGVRGVCGILKLRQDPSGMIYVGVVTVPFRDCSFVIKYQCPELEITGIRDSAVFAALALDFDESTGEPVGWAADPYDPANRTGVLRNRAEDPEWDTQFPQHPLSRLRSYLRGLGATRFSPRAAKEPLFMGPR
jgi:hypothetical protein